MGKRPDGSPIGEALVACSSMDLAQFIKKEKNNAPAGNSTIQITEASYKDWMQASGMNFGGGCGGCGGGGGCGYGGCGNGGGCGGGYGGGWGGGGWGCDG